MSGYTVFLVRTNTAAHRAAKLLALAGVRARLVPVPPELGTACGVALRVGEDEWERARQALDAAGLEIASAHRGLD